MDDPTAVKRSHVFRWLALALASAAVLIALYAAAGFLLAPWLVQRHVPALLQERLGREVRLGDVRVNPFLLTFEARDVVVDGAGQPPVIEFQTLFLDLASTGLLRGIWTVDEVRLTGLRSHVVVQPDGSLNLAELAKKLTKQPGAPAGGPPRVTVERLAVPDAMLRVTDLTGDKPAQAVLEPVALRAAGLSTFRADAGTYELSAALPQGGVLQSSGQLNLMPSLALAGQLEVHALQAATLWPFVRDELDLAPFQATADITARYAYGGGQSLRAEEIDLQLGGLRLAQPGQSSPLLEVERVALRGGQFRLAQRSVVAASLEFANGSLAVSLGPEGRVNWSTLMSSGQKPQRRSESAQLGWTVDIGGVHLRQIAVSYADASRPLPLRADVGTVTADMRLSVSTGARTQLVVRDVEAQVQQLALATPGAKHPLVTVDQASVSDGHLDLDRKRVGAADLVLQGGGTTIDTGTPHRPALLQVLASGDGAGAGAGDTAAADGPGWQYAVGQTRITGFDLKLRARQFKPDLAIGGTLQARVAGLESGKRASFEGSLAATGGGAIKATGTADPRSGSAEARVVVAALPLAPLQPVMQRFAALSLRSGLLSASASVRYGDGQDRSLEVNGEFGVSDLRLDEAWSGDRLLSWKQLDARGVAFDLDSRALRINSVSILEPGAKVVIAKDGSVNLMQVVRRDDRASIKAEAGRAGGPAKGAAPAFSITVDRLKVRAGEVDYADLSLVLPFSTRITEVNGAVASISNDPARRAEVQAQGQIPPYGSASVEGSLTPFDPARATDLQVEFSNVMVPPLSPYTATFAGRKVEAGKLWLDLHYRIEEGNLLGSNDIRLSDFTLGERVNAPEAVDLPLDLVVALLQGPNGEIRLSVPVRGDLENPRFSVAAAVKQALGNVLQRVVTAPFRALGRLFDTGPQALGAIAFDPGRAELRPQAREKLDALTGALRQRPQLRLVVEAPYDPEADTRELQRERARGILARALGRQLAPDEEPGPIAYEEPATRRALESLLEAHAGAQAVRELRKGAASSAGERALYQAMFEKLAAALPVPGTAPRVLAAERARAIAAYLQRQGVAAGRVETGQMSTVPADKDGSVTAQLRVAAQGGKG